MDLVVIKCRSDDIFPKGKSETIGKLRKRETQNMVGESSEENKNPKKNDIMSQINIYRLAIGTEHGL